MKMFLVKIILQLSTLKCVFSVPCGYKHPDRRYNHLDAWKCPNDTLCIQKQDVCAPPPYNIPRCPNGGDIGNSSCTEEFHPLP